MDLGAKGLEPAIWRTLLCLLVSSEVSYSELPFIGLPDPTVLWSVCKEFDGLETLKITKPVMVIYIELAPLND